MVFSAAAEQAAETEDPGIAVNEAYLILASEAKPLSSDYVPENLQKLVSRRNDNDGNNANDGVYTVSSTSIQLVKEAADALTDMMLDADDAGIVLYAKQGYRSYEDEQKRYDRARDQSTMQKPGQTDYQTGLAVTVVSKDWRTKALTQEFGSTEEARWIASNCARYGFVLRYPEGKQHVTGWAWEPWHLRYVGEMAADIMQLNHLCLEEFLEGAGLSGEAPGAAPAQDKAGNSEEEIPLPETTPAPEGVAAQEEAAEVPEGMTLLTDLPFETPVILPEGPLVLDQTGPDGDNEIILFHD